MDYLPKLFAFCSCLSCLTDSKKVVSEAPCCTDYCKKRGKVKTIYLKLVDVNGVIVECEVVRDCKVES